MRPVVITRPASTADTLAEAVRARGFMPLLFPTMVIGPAPDPNHLRAVLAGLARYALVVFVSPNAIAGALQALPGGPAFWPPSLPLAVMGPGSLATLARHGLARPAYQILSPAEDVLSEDLRFDSESLYAQLDVKSLERAPVLIVKGNGGRTWLADTLAQRGIAIETVQSYTRQPAPPDSERFAPLGALIAANEAAQVVITSSESIGGLLTLLEAAAGSGALHWLRAQRVIVPHARIAENATAQGFTSVVLSGPGDTNIVRALK